MPQEEQYFEELYEAYFPRIFSYIFRLCANQSAAEELTQETFYQAYLSLHKFKGNSDIYTWLVAIAKHVYHKYLRKNKNLRNDMAFDCVMETMISDDEQPEDVVEREFVRQSVRRLVVSLPPKYKDVVTLRIYAELSFKQIAELLKISENSAKVIFCRAKKILTEGIKNELKL